MDALGSLCGREWAGDDSEKSNISNFFKDEVFLNGIERSEKKKTF